MNREAQRQHALLEAIESGLAGAAALALREHGARAARGLEAYRANAQASAERALAAAFPTVQAMLGDDDFARLAREFRRADPPARGDLGEWGGALPEWLDAHAALAAWPWLADSARLDLAVHRNERAADAAFDAASLARLESDDPALLRLALMPGSALLRSRWPIASIHAAHRLEGEPAEHAFAAVRDAIAAQHGEAALVVRSGWRGSVHPITGADVAWTEAVLAGASIAAALEHAGPQFDFGAWLATALRESWLQGVAGLPD